MKSRHSPPRLPRLIVRRPAPGLAHPAGRADIARVLRLLGEEYIYGLRSIELAPSPSPRDFRCSGRMVAPGRILLYAQRPSPWLLPGTLEETDSERLRRAGAEVQLNGSSTRVTWPGETLRDFMLHVLLHELGHHRLQHYAGKRTARIARTRDHEAFADRSRATLFSRIAPPTPSPLRPPQGGECTRR